MFDLILKVLELVVNKLPDVDIAARKKRTFARSLMVLHECSIQIVENGREILDALDVYRESEQIDKKRLVELIAIQEGLIDRVSAILADQKYADVLKAKLPFLLSAQVFEEKKARIEPIRLFFAFHLVPDFMESGVAQRLEQDLFEYHYGIRAPGKKMNRRYRSLLDDIETSAKRLKLFVDRVFDVDEFL